MKSNAPMKSVKEAHCFGARPSCWWFSGTCEALVAHLGKPELLRSCRLVQPVGENGAFSSFKAKGGRAVLSGFSDLAHVLYPCRTTRS